jgi:diaminopimelate epimerase
VTRAGGAIELVLVSGAGNRFAVLDLFRHAPPRDAARLARLLCARPATEGVRLDGLLLVGPDDEGATARMVLYNADGSRPETCGNGLRCTARLLHTWGVTRAERFTIRSDAGLVAAHVPARGEVAVCLGAVRVVERDVLLRMPEDDRAGVADRAVAACVLDVGNPHAVLVVDDERTAPVAGWGPCIERDARIPAGTNVGFVALRDGRRRLRVWERGVGETEACGSGACAAARVLVDAGLATWPVVLELAGGRLTVDVDAHGGTWLAGPADVLGTLAAPVSVSTES